MSKKVACPTCGLYNSPFRARCEECGTSLSNLLIEDVTDNRTHKPLEKKEEPVQQEQKSTVICPYCDTVNDASSFRCKECGNQLVKRIEIEPIIEQSSFLLKDPKGHEITVSSKEPLILGREQIASLKQAQYISREHVKIMIQEDGIVFEDLHSMNGTWIDGTLLVPDEPTLFQDFNYIKLANVILVKVPMKVKRVVYPVHTLGYGKRIGIWTCGCPHHCKNCTSPELWESDCDDIHVFDLFEQIKPYLLEADGLTISGGDPMIQGKELARFVAMIKQIHPIEILVYTGYTLEELEQDNSFHWDNMKPYIDVLIDGRYMEELNDNKPLRGSSNQVIHYRTKDIEEKYKPLLSQERIIQDFVENGAIYIFGIPPKGFKENLKQQLQKDGFKTTL